jgi:hypothetical protein
MNLNHARLPIPPYPHNWPPTIFSGQTLEVKSCPP